MCKCRVAHVGRAHSGNCVFGGAIAGEEGLWGLRYPFHSDHGHRNEIARWRMELHANRFLHNTA